MSVTIVVGGQIGSEGKGKIISYLSKENDVVVRSGGPNQYLNNYENRIEVVIKKLREGTLPASKGGLIGTMRGISEYDSLASIKELYDAASDVDLFYSKECQKW